MQEEQEIFAAEGYNRSYASAAGLPILNVRGSISHESNGQLPFPWVTTGIKIDKEQMLETVMKQKSLEYLFKMQFSKEELTDRNLVVGCYEYKNPNDKEQITLYALVSLKEFLLRYGDERAFEILMRVGCPYEKIVEECDEAIKEHYAVLCRALHLKNLRNLYDVVYEWVEEEGQKTYINRYTKSGYRKIEAKSFVELTKLYDEQRKKDAKKTFSTLEPLEAFMQD
ncbi:hypothetical protein PAECIP111892_02893 [Paenibacillus auburnensis]|uniref:Uncharacterized protein n=1 Tax=Paenibacillus auburnensis TaxID=2905649 RepID=A0ABN8GIM3_9BACL|nr:hypothetical protein [Paenibacillus auburnensis]CAH1207437.1 hypothetical protein PAECIP111892_02893 [Paenibacillus auburnensis]